MKVKVIGQRSRSPSANMHKFQFSAKFQKKWSKVKVTRVKVTKVKGQGRRSRSKVIGLLRSKVS